MDSSSSAASQGGNTPVAPTLGSLVGSVAGVVVATKLGLDPASPGGVGTVSGITAAITALFHWIGSKIGVPGLT